MATRFKEGSLKKVARKEGRAWVLRVIHINPAPVAMAPLPGRYLRAWRSQTVFAADSDWVFASNKTKGKSPRVGNMLAAHYLRPAAVKAGVLTTTSEKRLDKEGKEIVQLHYWGKQGN